MDPKDDTFIILKTMFTCLFEGETSNVAKLKYKTIEQDKIFNAFYLYIYYFYIIENILEEELYRGGTF
jgi:hypothetical protein